MENLINVFYSCNLRFLCQSTSQVPCPLTQRLTFRNQIFVPPAKELAPHNIECSTDSLMCSRGDCVMDARIMCTLWLVSFYRDYISAADHGWWWIIEGFCRWGGIIIKADLTLISWYLFYGDHIMNRIRLYCWSFFNRAPYYSFTSHCYVTYLHFE